MLDRCLELVQPANRLMNRGRTSMSSKQSINSNHKKESPFNDFDLDLNATRLISDVPRHGRASFLEKIEIKPGQQQRIVLGHFTEGKPPKGFSVEFAPDPNPAGSVLTEVTSLGTSRRYKLILLVANYGTRAVVAEVWQL